MVGKILIVDDEDTLRLTIKTRLAAGGFETDAAVDGEEALEKLKQSKFDVVLLDINMPRMDGITALGSITELHPDTDVIMLTGFADFTTAIECLKKGARDYLVKPIDTTELITRLRSLLRARSSEAALTAERKKEAAFVFDEVLDPMIVLRAVLTAMSDGGFGKTTKEQNLVLDQLVETADAIVKAGKGIVNPSLLTADSSQLERKDVSFEKIAGPLIEQAIALGKASGLQVKSSVGSKLPKIQADAGKLSSGLRSTIAAVLAMSSKGSSVSIDVSKQSDDAGLPGKEAIVFEVQTTKVGEKALKASELSLKPLESMGSTVSGLDDQMLLLQSAKRVVVAHKGVFQVESKKGDGMVIRCFIPLK